MDYNNILKKYKNTSSWAIWKKRDITKNEKYGMDDVSFFNNMESLELNPNIVLVGLNISGYLPEDRPFCNFHPTSKSSHDYKTRYALEDTKFWGCYMTDIIKDYEEKVGSNVIKYLNQNPDFENINIKIFEEELEDINAKNPILIAFGNSVYKLLNKYFKNKYKIFKVSHYSSNISKEKLREEFLNLPL